MTDNEETQSKTQEPRISVGGEVVVPTQPQEVAYPLRREIFDILCEGESAKSDERWRDVAISVFATSVLSLITILATVDWDRIHPVKNKLGFLLFLLIAAITLSSLFMVIFFNRRVFGQKPPSVYARVKGNIEKWFNDHVR